MDKEGELNMPIVVEKTRVNVWNIVGFITGIAISAFGWGTTYASMTYADTKNAEKIDSLKLDVKDIQGQLPAISQLQFQMTATTTLAVENKKANEETNKRVDRVVETFGDKLDIIGDKVNTISTNVEVLKNSRAVDRRAWLENGKNANRAN